MDDAATVESQLGRPPRGRWRVAARCRAGYPTVIATAPLAEAGEPFPTLYYLTCPYLAAKVSKAESAGEIERWREALRRDDELAAELLRADARYREARASEGGGADPLPDVGIAGQRDPLALKCLHAHVAAYLAGIPDPIGRAVAASTDIECDDERCRREHG